MSQLIKVVDGGASARVIVIFVHGLGGHPYNTWRLGKNDINDDDTFWPRWIGQEFKDITVYTLGYSASPTGFFGQSMPLEDRAANVVELLLLEKSISHKKVTFICHSLGGLIVKYVLLDLKDQQVTRPEARRLLASIHQVAFLATPHAGSDHARFVDWFRWLLWPSPLTTALVSDAAALRRINMQYRLLAKERAGSLEHRVFYEKYRSFLGKIVSESSADPGLNELNDDKPVPIDADHFKIVKPKKRDTIIYRKLKEFIERHLTDKPDVPPSVPILPAYDGESQIDYFGLAIRIAGIIAICVGVWFFYPRAQITGEIDDLTKAYILTNISDDEVRLRIAGMLYKRKLSESETTLVLNIRNGLQEAPTFAPRESSRFAAVKTPDDLRKVLATLDLRPCGGTFEFKLVGADLQCMNGEKIPVVASKSVGGPLVSREAIVFHFTASGSTEGDLRVLSGQVNGVTGSAHLVVARSGAVVQLVPLDRQARHAGASFWKEKNITNLNAYSVGITFSNAGQLMPSSDGTFKAMGVTLSSDRIVKIKQNGVETYWESYTSEQIDASKGLVRAFRTANPNIALLSHSEITDERKIDPGPAFPLQMLRELK